MRKLLLILAISTFGFTSCDKNSSGTTTNPGSIGGTGQGGSLARFTIVNDYLYTVDGQNLNIFDIASGANPVFKNKINIGMDIEAIFPFKGKLFIASNSGMYIYGISNPIQPNYESFAQHLTGCDPVVANDSIAFLTVHGGNRCGSQVNQLQLYDIHNIAYPQFITSINLTNPYGLGLKDSVLFVCDNGTGIRAYNVKNPYNVKPMYVITGENYLDVIPMNNNIMVCMLTNGVAFMDISNLNQIVKLGTVKN